MTTNSQLSTTEPRKTKTKMNEANNQNRNRFTEIEITWRAINREWEWKNGGKVTGNKLKWQVPNRQGKVRNSMGNEEAKELVCMTNGHELRWRNDGRRGSTW